MSGRGGRGIASTVRPRRVASLRKPPHTSTNPRAGSNRGQTPYRPDVDVDAYLARIGYTGAREPRADVLADLHRAHMLAVPFENLDIPLGVENVLDYDHVFDKIVTRRRGGW